MRTKTELLEKLDEMLKDALRAKRRGAAHPHLYRAMSSADGYMKALIDAGIATVPELLARVAGIRTDVEGPALAETPAGDEAAA